MSEQKGLIHWASLIDPGSKLSLPRTSASALHPTSAEAAADEIMNISKSFATTILLYTS